MQTRSSLVDPVDNIGLFRSSPAVNAGDVLEQIDLQVSSIAGTIANLWAKDVATEDLLREAIPWKRPTGIIQEGYRIGHLMDGNLYRWWKNDPNGQVELARALRVRAPPYFEARRSLEDQAISFGRKATRWNWLGCKEDRA